MIVRVITPKKNRNVLKTKNGRLAFRMYKAFKTHEYNVVVIIN